MQATLEKAIKAVTGEEVRVIGSGRTDAGAHALGQVIAFSTSSALAVETLGRALNANLPRDVAVTAVADADPGFHPRFDARSRLYRYLIWNRPVGSPFYLGRAAHVKPRLDEHRMDAAARHLIGRHDLSSFIPHRIEGNRERDIYSASCRREDDLVVIELEASGFMRQMVRTIAGTLIRVGKGALTVDEFGAILAARDRSLAGDTAPAGGLYLVMVTYPADERQEQVVSTERTGDRAGVLSGLYEEK